MSTHSDSLRRFLEAIPHLPVEPGLSLARGAAWRDAASELGIACPAELAVLGDEQAGRFVCVGGWEMLDPDSALQARQTIVEMARAMPCLAPQAAMLPLFTADGDLLLLAGDGAVRRCSLASGALNEDHGVVTKSFAALLDALALGAPLPGLDQWYRAASAPEVWIDGIEYQAFVNHHHETRDGAATCITTLRGDLAPHYFRYPDGPGSPPLTGHVARARVPFTVEFVGDPVVVPRETRLHMLEVDGTQFDLCAMAERFVRLALARGWTGRDPRTLVIDGWEVLGIAPERLTRRAPR
jgi:hypothetical protein